MYICTRGPAFALRMLQTNHTYASVSLIITEHMPNNQTHKKLQGPKVSQQELGRSLQDTLDLASPVVIPLGIGP